MTTTLVLTRKPNWLFESKVHRDQHGRFGTLIVLKGAAVTSVSIRPGAASDPGTIRVPSGVLQVTSADDGAVVEAGRYTTIERMDGYVQLKPQEYNGHAYKKGPYRITYETGNSAVSKLSGTDGKCFRVHGGTSAPEHGILIHEAPHVGWLIGCVGPRRLGDYTAGSSTTAHATMNELFRIHPRPSALFVVDW